MGNDVKVNLWDLIKCFIRAYTPLYFLRLETKCSISPISVRDNYKRKNLQKIRTLSHFKILQVLLRKGVILRRWCFKYKRLGDNFLEKKTLIFVNLSNFYS